jgi:hypothetical protein
VRAGEGAAETGSSVAASAHCANFPFASTRRLIYLLQSLSWCLIIPKTCVACR